MFEYDTFFEIFEEPNVLEIFLFLIPMKIGFLDNSTTRKTIDKISDLEKNFPRSYSLRKFEAPSGGARLRLLSA